MKEKINKFFHNQSVKEEIKKFFRDKYVKGVLLLAPFVLFYLPFPVPYSYKPEMKLIGQGVCLSHLYRCENLGNGQVFSFHEFCYCDMVTERINVWNVKNDDMSQAFKTPIQRGQYVYIYAVGDSGKKVATTVKGDIHRVFVLRQVGEILLRFVLSLGWLQIAFLIKYASERK